MQVPGLRPQHSNSLSSEPKLEETSDARRGEPLTLRCVGQLPWSFPNAPKAQATPPPGTCKIGILGVCPCCPFPAGGPSWPVGLDWSLKWAFYLSAGGNERNFL